MVGKYGPILESDLIIALQFFFFFFLYLEAESKTISDWLHHTVKPIRSYVTFKMLKSFRKDIEYC